MATNFPNVKSPTVIYILTMIKTLQNRMKDTDLRDLEYIRVYDSLSREFSDFADNYTSIFTKVVKGENLNMVASILFYKDQVEQGIMSEEKLSELLAQKYLPENLRGESNSIVNEMKNRD